jgi:26S proteasome regulatory subunit N12
MYLLVENRLSDFHSELELLRPADRASVPELKFPSELEQYIMEGAYSKVIAMTSRTLPSPYFAPFVESLVETVR